MTGSSEQMAVADLLSDFSNFCQCTPDNEWSPLCKGTICAAQRDAIRTYVQARDKECSKERERCAEIVGLARFGQIDRDWRTIIHFIESGMTVEQVKKLSIDEPTE